MKLLVRMMVGTVALLICTAICTVAWAEDMVYYYAHTGQLEVRAQAIRTVTPDTVDITIGATAESANEREALSEANEVIANVIASLKELDVPENQIRTSQLNVWPRYNAFGSTRRIIGYTASVSLTVTLKDFGMINTVIDASVAHGANNIGGMQFSFSEEELAYRQALTDAITVARVKAEAMAAAAGVELGTLLFLRESGYNTYYHRNSFVQADMSVSMDAEYAGSQVMSGEIQIQAAVDLIYETR